MIHFPENLSSFLLAYVKREFYRSTRRSAFAERPFGIEDLRFFAKGASELSNLFTSERSKLQAGYLNQPQLRAAYLLYFLPINFAKTRFVLEQLPEGFWRRDKFRVVDLGCGPGSASLALLQFLKEKNPQAEVELTLVEQNANILKDAQTLIEASTEMRVKILPIAVWLQRFRFNGEYDLILMSHVLNELVRLSAQERGEWLLPLLERHLAPTGIAALLEPALKRPTRELMALRDHLLETREFSALAPCLHDEICPMLAATHHDWCHFYLDWEEPEYLRELDRLVKNDNRFLKVAYLIVGRREAWKQEWRRRPDLFRVVSNRMQTRGKTEVVLCGPPGRLTVSRLDRERGPKNAALDELRRGDLVQLSGFEAKGYEVGWNLRLGPKHSLKKKS